MFVFVALLLDHSALFHEIENILQFVVKPQITLCNRSFTYLYMYIKKKKNTTKHNINMKKKFEKEAFSRKYLPMF